MLQYPNEMPLYRVGLHMALPYASLEMLEETLEFESSEADLGSNYQPNISR